MYKIISFFFVTLLFCLILGCANHTTNNCVGNSIVFDNIAFELPMKFRNHKIDTVFVQYSYQPKHTYSSKNETILFYQFETCSLNEMFVRAAASYCNSTIFRSNNVVKPYLSSYNKVVISCCNNFHRDSMNYELVSFFIINKKLFLYEYNTINSKENIDTLTGINILNSIQLVRE
jgi:hypothetical protein